MIICPSCGAPNELTNRFCDQCGRRLTEPEPAPTPVITAHDQPTALATSCPSCGAAILPGERFCSICGADLMAISPVSTPPSEQATLIAPPSPKLVCPECGDPVLPGERFCDNCGADLKESTLPPAEAPTVIAPPAEAPTVIAPPAEVPTVIAPPAEAPTVIAPPAEAPTVIAPPAEAPTVIAPPAEAPTAEVPITTTPTSAVPTPATASAPSSLPTATEASSPQASAMSDIAAERARLEALLAAHRETVAQYEQMAARYPAGSVPAFITAGLDAARAELAKTEAELAALPVAPDPAEVARLEALLAAHRETVAQYEQMAARYPAGSVPAFITAGLDAAKAELAKTEAELAALTGSTPPAHTPAHPAAPTPIATPIVSPPPVTARLVLADGSEIVLPPGKSEYIIGREDPVSNIFPEIDLTPYGGELGGVSRQHAKIVHIGNQWSIVDLNSTNHTRVNGQRIEPQTPIPLSDGTKLQFGRLVATFHLS
jgi:predicted nucleic acid-binding Zn ribbon protein